MQTQRGGGRGRRLGGKGLVVAAGLVLAVASLPALSAGVVQGRLAGRGAFPFGSESKAAWVGDAGAVAPARGAGWGASVGGPGGGGGRVSVGGLGLRLRGGSGSSTWGAWGSPGGAASFQVKQKQAYNPEQDPEAEHTPDDGVTELAWSPAALAPKNYLVASSWDGTVRCWEVDQATAKTVPVGMQRHEKPAMCCGWTADGRHILTGGADGKGMMWEIATGRFTQVAAHDAPIIGIFYSDLPSPCIVTGSWDKTIKFWDPTSTTGQPLGVLQMPDRIYAMDLRGSVMVVATAERHILVYDLRNLAQPFRQKFSPLKYQTRCVSIFPDQTGFCVGSVEGRVAIEHIQDADLAKNFAFKCHRQNADSKQPEVYAVNAISFHPVGTFSTAGGDGGFNFWDKDAKHRLKAFSRADRSVSATDFSHGGELFAYAVNYDWSGGIEGLMQLPLDSRGSKVMIHHVKGECAPKANATK